MCLNLDAFDGRPNMPKIAKTHWKVDLGVELDVFKRDAGDVGNPLPSPIIIGNLVFSVTANGSTFASGQSYTRAPFVPRPKAPSFVAIDKMTGRVNWTSNAPGKNILYGQWSSPCRATVGGIDQVLFPGGDGWLYGFQARTGRLLWKVDCNPASSTSWGPGIRGTRASFMAAPVVRNGIAYIGLSQDVEMTDIPRPLCAVSVTHKGDATSKAIKWRFYNEAFGGTFGSAALGKDTLYALGDSGILFCVDPRTGTELWRSDLGANAGRFSSPCIHAEKVLIPAGRFLFLFQDGRKERRLGSYRFGEEIMGTPAVVQDRIYVATRSYLYCLRLPT